jgi:hypothetical protein
MKKPWITIKHLNDEYKIFFSVNNTPRIFDLCSDELRKTVENKISECKEEIEVWNSLLNTQKQWIESREYKC